MPEVPDKPGTYWATLSSPDIGELMMGSYDKRLQAFMEVAALNGEGLSLLAFMPPDLDGLDVVDRLEAVVQASGFEQASMLPI